jgi:hypothetical protein
MSSFQNPRFGIIEGVESARQTTDYASTVTEIPDNPLPTGLRSVNIVAPARIV